MTIQEENARGSGGPAWSGANKSANRRSEELREAWRRNHPIKEEDTDMNRTGRGTEDTGGAT